MCMRYLYAFVRVYGNADEVLVVCATEPYINKETMRKMVRRIDGPRKILTRCGKDNTSAGTTTLMMCGWRFNHAPKSS